MKFLEPLQNNLASVDSKTFRTYLIVFFGVVALITGLILWRYYSSVSSIHRRIRMINEEREQVKDLSLRAERVKEQKRLVEALIKQDPTFKIIGYFDTVLAQQRLMNNLVRRPDTRSNPVDTGHTEVTLIAHLTGLNMKTIAELLDTLERNERIHIKEIEITKPAQGRTVDLNLTIATLEPASQASETE